VGALYALRTFSASANDCPPEVMGACDVDVDVDVEELPVLTQGQELGAFDPVLSGRRRRWLFSGFEARGGENGMGS